jgi:hypothetical protein
MENDATVIYLEDAPGSVVNSLVKGIRVNSAGEQVWTESPATMSNVVSSKGYIDARANNLSQVIAVWQDKRSDPNGDVYLQNINPDGSLGALGPQQGIISGLVRLPDTSPADSVIVLTYNSGDLLVGTDTTDMLGRYLLGLGDGTYHELFSKAGYRDTTIENIVVVSGSIVYVNVTIQPVLGGCHYVIGDINGNGVSNGIDIVFGVTYFKGGSLPPISCDCPPHGFIFPSGDVNGNCVFNGIDITFYVAFLKGLQPALLNCPSCPPIN